MLLRLPTSLAMLLTALLTLCAPSPQSSPPAPHTKAERVEAVVRAWHEAGLFDGTALVADQGEILWQGGFGPADRAWDRPNGPDVRYPIASLTKQVTAVLILQQVQAGRLDLDAPLTDVLPWYRADTGARLTVRHLLSHTSGLPDTPLDLYVDSEPRAEDERFVAENHCSGDLDFEPGTEPRYSNADYHLLGAVLLELTGQGFGELVRAQLAGPLGWTDTELARRDTIQARRAENYVPTTAGGWVRGRPVEWENWGAAGGLLSSVGDLHRWNQALVNRVLLDEATTAVMNEGRPELGHVALGSWVYPRALPGSSLAPRCIERRGAIGGYASLNVIVEEEQRWIVLLANHYNEQIHTLPYARSLPLDLLLVLHDLEPQGPPR